MPIGSSYRFTIGVASLRVLVRARLRDSSLRRLVPRYVAEPVSRRRHPIHSNPQPELAISAAVFDHESFGIAESARAKENTVLAPFHHHHVADAVVPHVSRPEYERRASFLCASPSTRCPSCNYCNYVPT